MYRNVVNIVLRNHQHFKVKHHFNHNPNASQNFNSLCYWTTLAKHICCIHPCTIITLMQNSVVKFRQIVLICFLWLGKKHLLICLDRMTLKIIVITIFFGVYVPRESINWIVCVNQFHTYEMILISVSWSILIGTNLIYYLKSFHSLHWIFVVLYRVCTFSWMYYSFFKFPACSLPSLNIPRSLLSNCVFPCVILKVSIRPWVAKTNVELALNMSPSLILFWF